MSDLISRQAAIQVLNNAAEHWNLAEPYHEGIKAGYKNSANLILSLPSVEPERKKGKWLEMHCYEYKAQELQTCKCSVCGRYDTRPYLYYFSKPNFCSWCGADMKGEAE